jgi:hypothetical protein
MDSLFEVEIKWQWILLIFIFAFIVFMFVAGFLLYHHHSHTVVERRPNVRRHRTDNLNFLLEAGASQQNEHEMKGSGVSLMIDCRNIVDFDNAEIEISVSADGANFFAGPIVVFGDNNGRFFYTGVMHYAWVRIKITNPTAKAMRTSIIIIDFDSEREFNMIN